MLHEGSCKQNAVDEFRGWLVGWESALTSYWAEKDKKCSGSLTTTTLMATANPLDSDCCCRFLLLCGKNASSQTKGRRMTNRRSTGRKYSLLSVAEGHGTTMCAIHLSMPNNAMPRVKGVGSVFLFLCWTWQRRIFFLLHPLAILSHPRLWFVYNLDLYWHSRSHRRASARQAEASLQSTK